MIIHDPYRKNVKSEKGPKISLKKKHKTRVDGRSKEIKCLRIQPHVDHDLICLDKLYKEEVPVDNST